MKPIFQSDGGTVTAGNAPGVNDGASALVITSAEKAAELGIEPLARKTSPTPMPTAIVAPTNDWMLSDVPVSHNINATPASAAGTASGSSPSRATSA